MVTIVVGLGLHEINSEDNRPDFDQIRTVNVICEDIPQFSLSSFNTLSHGTSTSAASILSPVKGVHAILTKFRSEVTVRMYNSGSESGIDVTDYSWRLRKACLAILLSSGPVLSTVITLRNMFFREVEDGDWFNDREWLLRPSLFEAIWQW